MNSAATDNSGGMSTYNGSTTSGGSSAWQALQRLREKQQSETELLLERQRSQLAALKSARAGPVPTDAAAIPTVVSLGELDRPDSGLVTANGDAKGVWSAGSLAKHLDKAREQDSGFGGSDSIREGSSSSTATEVATTASRNASPNATTTTSLPAASADDDRPISAVGENKQRRVSNAPSPVVAHNPAVSSTPCARRLCLMRPLDVAM